MFSLEGKVAVVTGGSRGIGRADALALARAGADVVIADILVESDASDDAERYGTLMQVMKSTGAVYAEQTRDEIRQMGRRAEAFKLDVTDAQRVREVLAQVHRQFGGIHILVNNAGTLDHIAPVEQQQAELWERDLKVNLTGAYNCAQAVWPYMKAQKYGRIINMSSVAGSMGGYGQASYSTTKAGLLGLTRSLALEGARYGITCNAIVAGIIATEAFGTTAPAMRERMEARTAFRRAGKPEDVAHAIVFLASEEAGYITGAALPVAGGIDLFTF